MPIDRRSEAYDRRGKAICLKGLRGIAPRTKSALFAIDFLKNGDNMLDDKKELKLKDLDSLERAILTALIYDNYTCEIIKRSRLRASHFAQKRHQEIFKAIKDLWDKDWPVDLITVAEAMRERGTLEKIGGAASVAEITDAADDISAWAFITQHVQVIVDHAKSKKTKCAQR
jgi:Replicative DNA helicase